MKIHAAQLDNEALFRLKVMDAYDAMEPKNVRYLCRLFGIGKSTFYKWHKRYNRYKLTSLTSQSRRPKQAKTIPGNVAAEVCQWKQDNPAKSHYYLYQTWIKAGMTPPCSPKTIYNYWKKYQLIVVRHRRERRPTKLFNHATIPGELVQVDTKFLPNKRYQYTAIDVVSKWRYLHVYATLTQHATIDFLARLVVAGTAAGITIKLIQTDNGHEFQSAVRAYLTHYGIKHQYIWVHTPDQNGCVERSHRTDDEEFYQLTDTTDMSLQELNRALDKWIDYYNTKRLHFSLNFATPKEYLTQVSTM